MFIRINGRQHCLWRAVDQDGNVLDVLVQSRRNTLADKKFFRKLFKGLPYVPRMIVTDKLGSYQVAHRELLGSVEHRLSKYVNNRAENSHQPTRQRDRAMKRFTSLECPEPMRILRPSQPSERTRQLLRMLLQQALFDTGADPYRSRR